MASVASSVLQMALKQGEAVLKLYFSFAEVREGTQAQKVPFLALF
jgi:hypothetical protein